MSELAAAEAGKPTVWRIVFNPAESRGIRMMPLRDPMALEEVRNGEQRIGFLPMAYYERVAAQGVGK